MALQHETKRMSSISFLAFDFWSFELYSNAQPISTCLNSVSHSGYSSVVEHLTADQEVPSSNLGAPFVSVLSFRMVCLQYCENYGGRDRIVVSTLRCGRSNPGSNPGHGSSCSLILCFCLNLPTAFLVHFLQFKSCYERKKQRVSGAMDNASDYGSEDSRFDSWLARLTLVNQLFLIS